MSKQPNLKRQAINARIQARHQLLRLLYQWQITKNEPALVYHSQIDALPEHGDIDNNYLEQSWDYIVNHQHELESQATPYLQRDINHLDPIERAILWIGLYELSQRPDIHPSVSIDQAVELTKQYGGEDSHKFINGILDKIHKNHTQTA